MGSMGIEKGKEELVTHPFYSPAKSVEASAALVLATESSGGVAWKDL